ncbi:MAG TPA: carboxypeptidase-like regulatory domain-containing protein [Puia sp.]|nr:carboxypeptidase-like regulatory domain-containing protein [Puia sp.]
MHEPNKNITQYTTTDIQKYLEGQLSADEMNALEKASHEDPFLADAIEGLRLNFQNHSSEKFKHDIHELKDNIAKRTEKEKRLIVFRSVHRWPRIAAAAVILIGISFLADKLLFKSSSPEKDAIAQAENKKVTDSTTGQNTEVFSRKDSNNDKRKSTLQFNNTKQENTDIAQNKNPATAQNQKRDTPSHVKNINYLPAKNKIEEAEKTAPHIDSVKNIEVSAAPAIASNALQGKAAGIMIERKNRSYPIAFSGKVTDENKKPVAGASITFKNKKASTITDQNGDFKLSNPGNDSLTTVIVSSAGFQSTLYTLNSNDIAANHIKLKPVTSSLSEVVVAGYGDSKKRAAESGHDSNTMVFEDSSDETTIPDVHNALPIVGWPAYHDYLSKNKKINTADSSMKGTEVISFVVDRNNQLSSFKIKQSVSKAHDVEALRLVKQGPSWRLLKGKKERVTLAIEF